ncbi:MAG TPA: 4-oxalocrotonate tautomerase family protein [Mariprofundaceae bacterium]|nr:4-oxalocrotonate tautomerase family protein [Mariprofundaceae bacterium]
MPYINVRVAGALTREQKERIVAGITRVMQEVAGKPPEATYITIDEVDRGNWAKSGRLLD